MKSSDVFQMSNKRRINIQQRLFFLIGGSGFHLVSQVLTFGSP